MSTARFRFFGFMPFHILIFFPEHCPHGNFLAFGTNGLPVFGGSSGFFLSIAEFNHPWYLFVATLCA